jgi:hypothetical protein
MNDCSDFHTHIELVVENMVTGFNVIDEEAR